MPEKTSADWTSHPEDLAWLINYLHLHRSRAGNGGNFTTTVFNEAAALMATECPPKSGGPKTANSIATKWKSVHKLYDNILMKQKAYPGASGWTYTDEGGFNVTAESQDAWNTFIKAHSHFRHFATSGWVHFKTVGEIVPSRARGRHVFNAASTQLANDVGLTLQSQDEPDEPSQSSDSSQPLTDWSQTDFGDSQPHNAPDGDQALSFQLSMSASQPARVPATPAQPARVPATPTPAVKRTASDTSDDIEPPWSNKRSRATTGPESLLALGRSVDGIGQVIAKVLTPKVSSAISPTKKVQTARNLAREDANNGYLSSGERTKLHILFGRDTTAADAYISDDDAFSRADIGRELLNPADTN